MHVGRQRSRTRHARRRCDAQRKLGFPRWTSLGLCAKRAVFRRRASAARVVSSGLSQHQTTAIENAISGQAVSDVGAVTKFQEGTEAPTKNLRAICALRIEIGSRMTSDSSQCGSSIAAVPFVSKPSECPLLHAPNRQYQPESVP